MAFNFGSSDFRTSQDISTPAGKTAQQVVDDLKARGLLVARMTDDSVRFAVHKDISMEDVELAADIAVTYFEELAEQG